MSIVYLFTIFLVFYNPFDFINPDLMEPVYIAFLHKLRQLQDVERQAEWQEIREAIHPTGTNLLQPLQYLTRSF
jgi:hypothetical protein